MAMNDDMEKNRSENVARLEMTLAHAQGELAKYKAIAEKWEPVCHAEIGDDLVKFTLAFGGKRSTIGVPRDGMAASDVTSATSAIIDALLKSTVADRLREVVEPEVQRIQPSLKVVGLAGKW
jgi:hypothetical protein